jgi:hypothetical protein
MEKKTAIEWLIQKLIPNAMQMFDGKTCNAIEKAKEMEIKQNHSEYMRGWKDGYSKNEPK